MANGQFPLTYDVSADATGYAHDDLDALIALEALKPARGNALQEINAILHDNKDKDFIKRILNPELNKGREVQIAGEPEKLSHYMMQADNLVMPQVVDRGEKVKGKSMLSLLTPEDAYDYALRTGEYIQLPSEQDALWFSKNYKQYWNNGGE